MTAIRIIEFTDPICTWCWGSEPMLRALKYHFKDRIEIDFVMGGLVEDIRQFRDARNDIGGDPERSNAMIARHWREASRIHGMPTAESGMRLFSDARPSSFPQNVAFEAARIASADRAVLFLRRVREATYIDNRITSDDRVLLEIASEAGVDVARYLAALKSGDAERAFQEDRALCAEYGVGGFPAFMIQVGDNGVLLRSYQSLAAFLSVIEHLSDGELKPPQKAASKDAVLDFIRFFGDVFPVEIQTALFLDEPELKALLNDLQTEGAIRLGDAAAGRRITALTGVICGDGACSPG